MELQAVHNPTLESRFNQFCKALSLVFEPLGWSRSDVFPRMVFHGCPYSSLKSICDKGLLRAGHPLNPTRSTDSGWFGNNKKGIYVSDSENHFLVFVFSSCLELDYCAKYSNGMKPLEVGETAWLPAFRAVFGRSFHVPTVSFGRAPEPHFLSHSSPNFMERFLFNEAQLVPVFIFKIRAVEDNRTIENDGM